MGANLTVEVADRIPIVLVSGVNVVLAVALAVMAVKLRLEAALPLQRRSLSWLIVACVLLGGSVVLTALGLVLEDLLLVSSGGVVLAVFLTAGLVALYFAFASTRQEAAVLSEQAKTDDLTGLRNRRGFYELGNRAVAEAVAGGRPLTLLFMDLDDFKAYNDRNGHEAGNELLREVGA